MKRLSTVHVVPLIFAILALLLSGNFIHVKGSAVTVINSVHSNELSVANQSSAGKSVRSQSRDEGGSSEFNFKLSQQRRVLETQQERHFTTLSSPFREILCLGDSITHGNGASEGGSYPARLEALLTANTTTAVMNPRVHNYGVPGAAAQKGARITYWDHIEQHRKAILESNAFAVILQFGSNDAQWANWNQSNFVLDYLALIAAIQSMSSHPHVYVCIPPPVYHGAYNARTLNVSVVNEIFPEYLIRDIAARAASSSSSSSSKFSSGSGSGSEDGSGDGGSGSSNPVTAEATVATVQLIDFFSPLGGSELSKGFMYGRDGVHPNDNGYAEMARVVANALYEIL